MFTARPQHLSRHPPAPMPLAGGSRLSQFQGPRDTLAAMSRAALGDRGERSVRVRRFAQQLTSHIEPKDYLGEILAVRNVCLQRSPVTGAPLLRYVNDPLHVEYIQDPERLVADIETTGSAQCDCDEVACFAGTLGLVLGREIEWVAVGFSPGSLSHVGVRIKEPKSGQWVWIDPVAGPREAMAARRARERVFWKVQSP